MRNGPQSPLKKTFLCAGCPPGNPTSIFIRPETHMETALVLTL